MFFQQVFDVFFTNTFNKDVTYDGDEFPCRSFVLVSFFFKCAYGTIFKGILLQIGAFTGL